MVLIQEVVHPAGLSFQAQRKVVQLRDDKKMKWDDIRNQVKNLKKLKPSRKVVTNAYKKFNKKEGHAKFSYGKCGRAPWKITPTLRKFIVDQMLKLRRVECCTSPALQRIVAKQRGITKQDRNTAVALPVQADYDYT